MLELDDRDLGIWLNLAIAELDERQLNAMMASRSAWMDSEEFQSMAQSIQNSINRLRTGKTYEQEIRENWQALKELGR